MVLKNSKTLYEGYFNGCTAIQRCHVYSVTKSIISILIELPWIKDTSKTMEQKVLDFSRITQSKRETTIQIITLDLLGGGDRFYKQPDSLPLISQQKTCFGLWESRLRNLFP